MKMMPDPETPDASLSQAAPKALPRYRRAPAQVAAMVLTRRDLALLEDVARFGVLTTSQLQTLRAADPDPALRFPSRLTLTGRLKLLFHHRYVGRLGRPMIAGSQEMVYLLEATGARAIREFWQTEHGGSGASPEGGELRVRPASRWPKAAALDHLLGIVQLRVALTARERRSRWTGAVGNTEDPGEAEPLRALEWQGGDAVRFRVSVEKRAGRPEGVSLIPDGAFVARIMEAREVGSSRDPLARERAERECVERELIAREYFAFVEVDRGTETGAVLREKMRTYATYLHSGAFAREWGLPAQVGFRVLFVVPSASRARVVLCGAAELAAQNQAPWMAEVVPAFRVALAQSITPDEVLQAVWWQGDPQAPTLAQLGVDAPDRWRKGRFWKRLKPREARAKCEAQAKCEPNTESTQTPDQGEQSA